MPRKEEMMVKALARVDSSSTDEAEAIEKLIAQRMAPMSAC